MQRLLCSCAFCLFNVFAFILHQLKSFTKPWSTERHPRKGRGGGRLCEAVFVTSHKQDPV